MATAWRFTFVGGLTTFSVASHFHPRFLLATAGWAGKVSKKPLGIVVADFFFKLDAQPIVSKYMSYFHTYIVALHILSRVAGQK